MKFGRWLRTQRKAAGLTGRQLADTLGVSVNTVYSWELGNSEPTVFFLKLVARWSNLPDRKLGQLLMEEW